MNFFTAKTSEDVIQCCKAGLAINHTRSFDGNTSFGYHCFEGNLEVVTELVRQGCNILKTCGSETGFIAVCQRGHTDIFKFLVEYFGYGRKLFAHDEYPFHEICSYGHTDMFDILVSLGVYDEKSTDILNRTPLQVAIEFDQIAIVRRLLDLSCTVSPKDFRWCCSVEMMRILYIYCDVNYTDKFGNDILITYIRAVKNIKLIEELLVMGANVNHSNRDGKTALHHAYQHNRFDVAILLEAAGADKNALDYWGRDVHSRLPMK